MKTVRVPGDLDAHPRFLLWRADLAFVWISVTAFGALVEHPFYGALIGTFCAWRWHRKTLEEGRGFLKALVYWHLGDRSLKRMLQSSKRHFIG